MRRVVLALIAIGVVGRVVWAFAAEGVAYDIESLQVVADGMQGDPLSVYGSDRWPYPGAFLPVAALADVVADALGLPFHGVVQLPAIAADAAIAWVVWRALLPRVHRPALGTASVPQAGQFDGNRSDSERAAVAGAALVTLSPVFVLVSGYHGQIDSVAVLPALLGVLVWGRGVPNRALWAGLLIGLGAAVKQPPIFMVLALLPTAMGAREGVRLAICAAAVPLVSLLPFLIAEPGTTIEGVTANRGVPGFGGLSAFFQPELTRYWATLDHGVGPNSAVELLTDAQNWIVGVAVLATGALLIRRRVEPFAAASTIWLVVYATNPNFAFQYLIWGLPFFILTGHLRRVAILTAIATPPALLLYLHPDLGDDGWVYWALVQGMWVALVVTTVRALGRV